MLSVQKKEISAKKTRKNSSPAQKSTSLTSKLPATTKKKTKSLNESATDAKKDDKKRKTSASSSKSAKKTSKTKLKKTVSKKTENENEKSLDKQGTKNMTKTQKENNNTKPKLKKRKSDEKLIKKVNKENENNLESHSSKLEDANTNLTQKPPRPKAGPKNLPPKVGINHKDSIHLYKKGYGQSQGLVVTKSSTEKVEKNQSGRPVFHLPLNLNDSTASFLGNSPGGGPSYLEMSSGLLPHHPQNKYNFNISLDGTNETSQTANMLKNFIFDDDNVWNSGRTEPAHIEKKPENQEALNVPLLGDEAFDDQNISSINRSDEASSRSLMPGRSSTRLSFIFNKNTGLLCKNCFSSNCDHMEKFNTLATPKLKKVFRNSESFDQPSPDPNDQGLWINDDVIPTGDLSNESMRLIDVNNFNHHDTSSGEQTVFRELNMEYEMQFETSTPNEDVVDYSIQPPKPVNNNDLNLSGSMLRYTPGIMNQNSFQQTRPNTNESLKYDSDFDDDTYLQTYQVSANSTFETLDINSGVLFSNIEQNETQQSLYSSSPSATLERISYNPSNETKKIKTRKISMSMMPDLPTVFEEKSAPSSAVNHPEDKPEKKPDELENGLEELLNAVSDNLSNMVEEKLEPDSLENSRNNEILTEHSQRDLTETTEDNNNNENLNDINENTKNESTQLPTLDNVTDNLNVDTKSTEQPETTSCGTPTGLKEEEDLGDKQKSDEKEDFEKQHQTDNSPNDSGNTIVNNQEECPTPLERQGVFKRIQSDDEEKYTPEQISEDQLQAWLQANRKHTFEREYFSKSNDLHNEMFDSDDKEVLEINTPNWAEKPKINKTSKKNKQNKNESSKQVDVSTQSDSPILPIISPNGDDVQQATSTAGSSDLPNTQGSYRQIDLLVLDRSRDQRLVQENRLFELAAGDVFDARDADSGIQSVLTESVRTEHSDATVANDHRQYEVIEEHLTEDNVEASDLNEEANYGNVDEAVYDDEANLDTEPNQENEDLGPFTSTPLPAPQRQYGRSYQNQPDVYQETNNSYLPAIDSKYTIPQLPLFSERETFYETPFSNRLALNHPYSSPYFSSDFDHDVSHPHRDMVSPILEHHMKMAQYHKERVAMLTPLYSASNSMIANRHIMRPRPPISKIQHSNRSFKRRFSAGKENRYYERMNSHADFVDSLSEISPRTRPYVPHPPSYERAYKTQKQMPYYGQEATSPIYDQRWQRRSGENMSHMHRARKIETKNDTTLYLTQPYRSVYMRPSHKNSYNEL